MKKYIILSMLGLTVLSAPVYANESEVIDKAMRDVLVHKKDSIELLSPYQIKVYAYKIGAPVNLGETLRAITFLESRCGAAGRIGDNGVARGITQIQIPTAKFIFSKLMGFERKFSNKEIKMLITKNDKLNIIMSKNYLVYLMKMFKNKWSHGLLSYNIGPGNTLKHGTTFDPNNYLAKATHFINKSRL